ncbi:flagellar hook-associated protein 1 FlgK [Cohaesibacter marisflavi]|uniref:Flagellar hook-associated protein 1 n=1 Tax=Cohaesibacter marisflavi TaxID=655353 RepID=A0A1I5CFT1_9HYPH|nr:flagellar hook-associated protein FlgK [Cohaesibacter marisflavi]SFN85491.1 flagellar hook-associated protein 1 FlgK [Cohaesibacter marisflavi]
MTSLNVARYIASSSLGATQVQVSVTANNIANADTEGYTVKSASASSRAYEGVGGGVSVDGVSSSVSKYLLTDLLEATSGAASATKTAEYLSELQSSLGTLEDQTGAGTSLGSTIADFEEALTQLATTPESTALANNAVTALEDLTSQIRDTASDLQGMVDKADQEIAASVDDVNEVLETIDELNDLIRTEKAAGNSTANLEDQLNSALTDLSGTLDIKTFPSADGTTKVYTTTGQILVGSTAHLLSTGLDAEGQTTISVNGSDITSRLNGGNSKIGALLELRDETLPEYQAALDEMATTMITTLNGVAGLSGDILTGTSASDIAVETTVKDDPTTLLGTGNGATTANNLLDALQGDTSFSAAGKLSAGDRTFSEYATEILSAAVSDAQSASTSLNAAEADMTAATDAISSAYGVNVDEETARLSELEQLYSIASTILSTLQEMFDDLQAAVS